MIKNNKIDDYVEGIRTIVYEYLKQNKKIDDAFFERFFGKKIQAQFLSGNIEDKSLEDAMIMNGLAGIDCRDIDFSGLSLNNYIKLPFDSETKFPKDIENVFFSILEKGKDFGYGLEELIKNGKLFGEGIHVAIIDEDVDISEMDTNDINIIHEDKSSGHYYHGLTVSSLLASKTCGVAKGATVHFFEKTSEKYRLEKDMYEKAKDKGDMNEEDYKKWKAQAEYEKLEDNIRKIVEYNKCCTNDSDKITVLSGSWRIPQSKFERWQQDLRSVGCEFVCQNNFIRNFTEISGNDIILDMNEEEKKGFSNGMREYIDSTDLDSLIKIPINRTYHQYDIVDEKQTLSENEDKKVNFKYQASYSNSWGIPQVAGLLALYKAKDKSLTFENFCELCRQTANEKGVINPVGIYEEIEKRLEQDKISGNSRSAMEEDEVK